MLVCCLSQALALRQFRACVYDVRGLLEFPLRPGHWGQMLVKGAKMCCSDEYRYPGGSVLLPEIVVAI